MATFNVSKYKKLSSKIEVKVDEMISESIALPIILGDVFDTMVHQYNVAESDLKSFKDYVNKKIYEYYLLQTKTCYERYIDWKTMPGIKLVVWKSLVNHYYSMESFDNAVTKTCNKILKKYDIPNEYALWIGVYIREAADIIFFNDTDCGLEAMLYEGFDLNESTYKGVDLSTNQTALSSCPGGIVNDNNEIISPFAPETVELFMDMYDSMTWDVMPDDYKEIILQKYDIPDYMVRTFAETWRGVPIFTHDILVTTVYSDNDEYKGDVMITHILMGDDIITLVLQNDNNVIIQENDIQFSMNIGSLHDHPELMEMYETALSTAIMNNSEN